MNWLTTTRQWLVIPGFKEVTGDLDFPALVMGLNLIQLHGQRLAPQRFHRPLASGGLLIGTPMNWLRATYLLERRSFLVESGGYPGAPLHSTVPVPFDVLISYLATWLYTDFAHGFTLTEYEDFASDPQADAFWTYAYRDLLGLPAEPALPQPPRTTDQQRADGMIRSNQQRWLLPEIERLEAKLTGHLRSREVQDDGRRRT